MLVVGVPGTLLLTLALTLLAARIGRRGRHLAAVPAAMLAVAWLTYYPDLYAAVPAVLLVALSAWPAESGQSRNRTLEPCPPEAEPGPRRGPVPTML